MTKRTYGRISLSGIACIIITTALGVTYGASHAQSETVDPRAEYCPADLYPPADHLNSSPGGVVYYIDPAHGNDANPPGKPWRSLARINTLKLGPGDRVEIAPGVFHESFKPTAVGTEEHPVVIHFQTGGYLFRADHAIKLRYFVTNSADYADQPRPIGILVKDCRHLRIEGSANADIWYGDRMTEIINDHSEDITYSGLNIDLVHPTVCEYRVLKAEPDSVVIQVAEGCDYAIDKGRFRWTNDLGPGAPMNLQSLPDKGQCKRIDGWEPFSSATAEDLGGGKVRLAYQHGNMGMIAGQEFSFRNLGRDNTSVVNTRCKNIVLRDCNFYSLPGMGLVNQFTENLTMEHVQIAARPGTLRACQSWADCCQISNCRGKVLVDGCKFSGSGDDAINVHGTHLRIITKTGPRQILVRFMQWETYGFAAFQPGDAVAFVRPSSLQDFATGKVLFVERKTDHDWLLTLEGNVPVFEPNDVVDNLTWQPDVTVRDCFVTMDSCRGFLLTTRGKVLVEGNTFDATTLSGIDIADDASNWFESGPVRDVTIRNNRFIHCGNPLIYIHPEIRSSNPSLPVHQNIKILNNYFGGGSISARGVRGLVIDGNRFTAKTLDLQQDACTDVAIGGNEMGVLPIDWAKP